MHSCRTRTIAAVFAAMTVLGVGRVNAQGAANDGWRFQIAPYFLMPGLNGKVGYGGITTDLAMDFGDILDRLDMGIMVMATAQRGRWVFGFDAMYFKLSDQGTSSASGPFGFVQADGTLELTTTQQIYQPTLAYRLFDTPTGNFDAFVAARYTSLENDVYLASTTTIPSLPGGTRTLSDEQTWWDPVVGGRTSIPFAGAFAVNALADFGGFAAGCDVTYQWLLTLRWDFATHFAAAGGYRYMKQDYEEDGFVWDMVMKGPILGVGFAF